MRTSTKYILDNYIDGKLLDEEPEVNYKERIRDLSKDEEHWKRSMDEFLDIFQTPEAKERTKHLRYYPS